MILLDTNVVSALRSKRTVDQQGERFKRWSEAVDIEMCYLSAISIAELETGVGLKEVRDPIAGAHLRKWLDETVLPAYAGRILPVDCDVALLVGKMHVPVPRSYRDAMIAATAIIHSLTVVTRNVADFQMPLVKVINPW